MPNPAIDSVLTRRQLLVSAGRVGALAITPELLLHRHSRKRARRNVASRARTSVLYLSNFGAQGDGKTDDTAALRAALNAASPGTTVMGSAGATYLLSDTVDFLADNVTLDLAGGALQIGPQRVSGSQLQTNDTILRTNGHDGVRVTNGSILASLSPYTGGGYAYRVQINGGQRCAVDHLTAECDGGALVWLTGRDHSIANNKIEHGGIMGLASTNTLVQGNVIRDTGPGINAISFVGYAGAPVVGTQYLNNVIAVCGRIGIEEYSPDGPELVRNALFRGNHIAGTAAQGISATGAGATFESNTIVDASGWGIEASGVGTTVRNNDIRWSAASQADRDSTGIVINGSIASNPAPVIVHGNTVRNAGGGIELFADTFYGPVSIDSNRVIDAHSQAITLAGANRPGLVRATNNTVIFNQAPPSGANRYGIHAASGAVLNGNQVRYASSTYRSDAYDTPYAFVGNDVTMTSNLSDGGGRSDAHIFSFTVFGSYSGWKLTGNRFINGAPAYKHGLLSPKVSGNVGLS